MSVTVTFEPEGRRIRSQPASILEIARNADVSLRSDCGGKGVCGKCKVVITGGNAKLNSPTSVELKHLKSEELSSGYRLACQAQVAGGSLTVLVPPESRMAARKIAEVSIEQEVPLEPAVVKIPLTLPKPSLSDIRPDFERLRDELSRRAPTIKPVDVELQLLKRLPSILRSADWNVTAVLWNGKLIDVEEGNTSAENYGVGLDVGSSKIICHLVDLNSGETLARGGVENPQMAYGEDVVSRITYASRSEDNLKRLQKVVVDAINGLIEDVCGKAGASVERVYEAVAVGNTVMHHLLFGINPRSVGLSPFVPAVRGTISAPARELGVKINPNGRITALPVIAGFVGADAVADILITGIHRKSELSMVIDVGTNTEIMIGNSDAIFACSAPSGPAFEGAHITHGMKAVTGAIESVRIENARLHYEVIGGAKPKGICGSGMIELIAELYKAGIIKRNGKLIEEHERIIRDKVPVFVVAWGEETESGKPVTVTEKDINEFLLAKAAIRSGWQTLMENMDITPQQLDRIYIAGSFGKHIDVESAKTIGLLPDVETEKIVFAGDTAVGGAKMALKSTKLRREAEELLEKIRYVELSIDKKFYQTFTKAILLP
ncbi:MAG: ASKHA domain-containing protein [Candidatus Jordarchaeales archaeon]